MKQSILIFLFLLGVVAENSCAQPNVGEPAPQIQFSTAIGKARAADFTRGKYVVLEFWATWCGPCIGGFPHFNSLIKKLASDSVLFVSVTNETDAPRIKDFVTNKAKLDAINLLDDNQKTWKAFNISSIPTTVVIGKNGNVLWAGYVTHLTVEKLENLLKGINLPEANPVTATANPAVTAAPKEEGQKKTSIFDFSLNKVYTPPANASIYWGTNEEGQRYYSAPYTSLTFLLSENYQMQFTRVLIPKEMMDYPMLELKFAVDTALDQKKPKMMTDLILNTLNISANVVTRDTMVWQMEVTDRKLLNKYKSVQNGHRSSDRNKEKLIMMNFSFQEISEYLEDYFKAVFTAVPDDTNDEKAKGYGYDLMIPNVKSFDELNAWMKKNIGIHFFKKAQAIKFLQVTTGESQSVTSGR